MTLQRVSVRAAPRGVHDVLVVPLDGSSTSRRALPCAELVARTFDTPLQLVTVSAPGSEVEATERELAEITAGLDAPVREPLVLTGRDVAEVLCDHVRAHPRALLCMATHGRTALASACMGSVTAEVLAASTEPVLLVGPNSTAPGALRTIAVGVEVSRSSLWQIPFVLEWAVGSGARLELVTVVTDTEAITIGEVASRVHAHRLAMQYRAAGENVSWRVIHGDDVGRVLNVVATEAGASMLVVGGTRRGGGLARVALGSIAQYVVRHAPCPVLVIPPPRDEEEEEEE